MLLHKHQNGDITAHRATFAYGDTIDKINLEAAKKFCQDQLKLIEEAVPYIHKKNIERLESKLKGIDSTIIDFKERSSQLLKEKRDLEEKLAKMRKSVKSISYKK